jgi:hypothetical protein
VNDGARSTGRGPAAGRIPATGCGQGWIGKQEADQNETGQQPGEEQEAAEDTRQGRLRAEIPDTVDDSHPLDTPARPELKGVVLASAGSPPDAG